MNLEQPGGPLSTGYVSPIWLRIEKDSNLGIYYRQCHYYKVGENNMLDLYVVENGRLVATASFNDIRFVEEVSYVPSEPSPETPPTTTIAEDDIPL
jgi:hypothetical protein